MLATDTWGGVGPGEHAEDEVMNNVNREKHHSSREKGERGRQARCAQLSGFVSQALPKGVPAWGSSSKHCLNFLKDIADFKMKSA